MITVETKIKSPTRLSPAALTRFRVCEKQFYFAHIDRRPQPEQTNPMLAQGNAIHGALDRFFGLRPEDREPAEAVLHRALRNRWPEFCKHHIFLNRDQEREFGLNALALMSSFAANFDTTVTPLARERWVSTRLPNGTEVYGKVDRVDTYDDGIAVIDYKTGRRRIEEEDLHDEPAAQVYTLAAQTTFDRPVRLVRFIYLSGDSVAWYPEEEDVEAIGQKLTALTTRIREADDFPASPGDACDWCPFALRCPDHGRVELADLTTPEGLPF